MTSVSKWETPSELEELGQFETAERISAKAKECKKAGKDMLMFLGSDPPREGFTNKPLSDALIEAARGDTESYPGATSLAADLNKAISEFEKRRRNIDCPADNIIVGPGVGGCWNILQYATLVAGDEIIVFDPQHYFSGPMKYIGRFGAKAVPCDTLENEGWKPNLDELRKRISQKTKMIVICNPNNPTGSVWDEKVLRSVADIAAEHKVPIVSDEIYGLITYDGIKASSVFNVAKDVPTIVMSGMSKFFMRPGWRIGYMCINDPHQQFEEVTSTAKKVASMYGHPAKCIPTPIYYAAIKAYQDYKEAFAAGMKMVKETQKHRDFVWKRLKEIRGLTCTKTEGALYAFPKIPGIGTVWKTDEDFMLNLIKEESVIWYIGSHYGRSGIGHIRVLLQSPIQSLEKGLNRLEHFLDGHVRNR